MDQVVAPALILVGRNDSRCPYAHVMRYVERREAQEHPHGLYVFETGHGSFEVDERIRQMGAILEFLAEHVPGIRAPNA